MTFEDTEEGVRLMFWGICDLPEVSRVVPIRPGKWRVFFGDGSEATAFPRKGHFEFDPDTVPRERPF